MADTKVSALAGFTPIITDLLYGVDDPGGTPVSGQFAISALRTLLNASPTLVTPTLGVAVATTINKVAITAPATGSTLTILDGKTLTANHSLTLAGTDGTTMTFPGVSASIPGLAVANTFTALQTITQAANDTQALLVGGASVTGSGTTAFSEITGTFNTSGAAAGLRISITNTSGNNAFLIQARVGGTNQFTVSPFGDIGASGGIATLGGVLVGSTFNVSAGGKRVSLASDCQVMFSSGSNPQSGLDTGLKRTGVGILGVTNASTGGGVLGFQEVTAPSAPASDGCYLYAVDNGAGKTQLMALFSSGAAQQVAIQP